MKNIRVEELTEYAQDLKSNIDEKYDQYWDDDMNEMLLETLQNTIEFYDLNLTLVNNENTFEEKKLEVKTAFDEIFKVVRETWKENNQHLLKEKEMERKLRERERKMKALGITGGNQRRQNRGGGGRNNRKMTQKQKLKLLKQQLAKEEQEKQKQQEKPEENYDNNDNNQNENEEEEKSRDNKNNEKPKDKVNEANIMKKKDNDETSDSQEEEKEAPKRNNNNNNNNNRNRRGRGRNNRNNRGNRNNRNSNIKNQNQNQNQKNQYDDSSNSDSDSDEDVKPKKKNNNKKRNNNINNRNKNKKKQDEWGKSKAKNQYDDSDDSSDEEIQKPKKKNNKNNKKDNETNKKHEDDIDDVKESVKEESPSNDNKKDKKNKKNKKEKKKKAPLKSPICVVMGHVDTGKTKILDHIRKTSVQNGEVGGITQQIGATFLSTEYIAKETTRMTELKMVKKVKLKVPGLLFIDTPGHESFTNLRARGSSLCDIAILVVDITGGLEKQTVESLKLLKEKGAPFVVALNKIDKCLDWVADKDAPFLSTFKNQKKHTQKDFNNRLSECMLQFSQQGLNCALWYENKNFKQDISLVPTSAHTGEGIPDLLYLITQLTQRFMEKKLAFKENKFICNVLEVKNTVGHGTTLDVILSNGVIRQGDRIVCCGMKGRAIDTKVRALLLPQEASEMRVKGDYKIVDEVHASAGLRISAKGLEDAVPGSNLLLIPPKIINMRDKNRRNEEIEKIKDSVQSELDRIFANVDKNERGVFVQSSTLGSLEALIRFLNEEKIPICGMGIGNIKKEDVMRAGRMLEHQKEFACILAFNINIQPDAREIAQRMGVTIFEAEIIYHLQDQFEEYVKDIREKRKIGAKDVAVFPVELEILPEHIIRNKHPIVVGCRVRRGTLRINTPICAKKYINGKPSPVYLGKVVSLQNDNKDVPIGKVGDKLAVKIEGNEDDGTKSIQVGRQFTTDNRLISRITRESLDALKKHFKDEIADDKDALQLLRQLKEYFQII